MLRQYKLDRVAIEFKRFILSVVLLSVILLIFAETFRDFVVGEFLNQIIFLMLAFTIIIIVRLSVIVIIRYKGSEKEGYRERIFGYWSEVGRLIFVAPFTAYVMLLKFTNPTQGVISDIIYIQTVFSFLSSVILIVYMIVLARRRFM